MPRGQPRPDHRRMQNSAPAAAGARRVQAGWSFPPRVLDLVDWFAGAFGRSSHPLSARELVELARRRTGLADFGDEPFEEPLQILLESYEDEASLSAFGKMAARWDTVRFLSNLLMLRDAEKRRPEILREVIDQPVFITGLPRSGTTFLHYLFAQDPANRFVRCWETIYPCAEVGRRPATRDWRANRVDRHLNTFARIAPEVRRVHPIDARSPQECTEITAHVFRSLRFDTTHCVPSYQRWLDQAGHLAAYRFHRRFLCHMQHDRTPGRWVLKSPDHIFALDDIRQVYPDARFIFMHRSPLDVLPSLTKLTEVLRAPFTRTVNRSAIGEQVTERWVRGTDILANEAETTNPCATHVHFRALVQDPLGTVSKLYDWLGLEFSPEAAERLRRSAAAWPQGKDPGDKTRLEEYGLSAELVRGRFRDYMSRCKV